MTPSPLPDPDFAPTRPFFQGAARGRLCIPRCSACRAWIWYPQERCPACSQTSLDWEDVCGRGTLYSWAVVRRALWKPFADRVPYVTGLVALEEAEAVRVVTTLVDCTPDELRVGLPVHAVFRPLRFAEEERELVVPFFTPTR